MLKKHILWLTTLLFTISVTLPSTAQKSKTTWSEVNESNLASELQWSRKTDPAIASYYRIDLSALKVQLQNAPQRGVDSQLSTVIIDYPTTNGVESFRVKEASIMATELQAEYPDFRSYVGQSVKDAGSQIRFSITSQGFHGMMFSTRLGTQFVDSYSLDNSSVIVYKKSDLINNGDHWECHVDDTYNLNQRFIGPDHTFEIKNANDGLLRDFRLAISTTVEYSEFHWQRAGVLSTDPFLAKRNAVVAAIIVTMTRNNFIYERDLSVTMTLVANNSALISIDSDNFSNDSAGDILGENQVAIDAIIGFSNYDIGHIFSTGGGGLASLASPCTNRKAQGVTGSSAPLGDPFDVDFVAHELGHQLGAPHSFNGDAANCVGGNRSENNAFEPGSGSTIMAYAGICPPQNIQNNSDAYFHQGSLNSIFNNISSGLGTCAQTTLTGNSAPVAIADSDYVIPRSTAYKLVGNSTDVDGTSTHTYTWEQNDLGTVTGFPQETNATGPMVRSFEGTSDKVRYIPRLEELRVNGGNSTQWEKLSSVSRVQTFDLTVRDNDTRGGQTDSDEMIVQVDANAGPFRVTSQNVGGIVWLPNTVENITWDVAGTDANTINTANVNILLSTDGGLNFDTVLAANVPNTGSYALTVPEEIVSPNCRIMIEGAGNIFFALNSREFNINADVQITCTTYQSGSLNSAIPDNNRVGVSSTLNVPLADNIESIKLGVDISHTYIQDLIFSIIDPSGSNQAVAWNRECTNQNDVAATFEDDGATILCRQPTVGNFAPSESFSVFNGVAANGDWTLRVSDNVGDDIGTLNSWSLEVCVQNITPLSNESFELDNLSIYPNPSNGNLNILFDNASSNNVGVTVFDLSGRSVFKRSYETSNSFNQNINLGAVSAGMYLVNIVDGNRTITKKIIVE
ncbi:reprolysin-like metallopeptidase [uncultured Nonlabens sp.]|uniref:zinc-dependent metalloprotease n=1 Tax=uncultured Nonlabens sp. TaxID=859306 RepID=UPI002633A38A|nr:zinc-dependent metalloprotease family protein [uncultured Nonlabens sp.]